MTWTETTCTYKWTSGLMKESLRHNNAKSVNPFFCYSLSAAECNFILYSHLRVHWLPWYGLPEFSGGKRYKSNTLFYMRSTGRHENCYNVAPTEIEGGGSSYSYVKHFIKFVFFCYYLVFWRFAKWSLESHDSCSLTFKRRIKSHLPFAGIIRSSPYSPR